MFGGVSFRTLDKFDDRNIGLVRGIRPSTAFRVTRAELYGVIYTCTRSFTGVVETIRTFYNSIWLNTAQAKNNKPNQINQIKIIFYFLEYF